MRIFLAGGGDPIPLEAMPDLTDENALTLIFSENGSFDKAGFVDLGFTHAEIICVGAAGGKAGRSNFRYNYAGLSYELYSHGGAGGGGGLHVVASTLEDLADSCPLVVGVAGVDGADGVYSYGAYGGSDGAGTLDPGDPGTDGSYSSFDGVLCRASGGKGGASSLIQNDHAPNSNRQALRTVYDTAGIADTQVLPGGNGGQGGKGDQTTAGGGGDGGLTTLGGFHAAPGNHANTPATTTEPENGSWDGHIGEGGGGGRGGTYAFHLGYTVQGPARNPSLDELAIASNGGHGAFDFADTSVYGPRQLRSGSTQVPQLIVPGSGGGSRPLSTKHYGGRGVNATPHGVVIVRLLKLT